MFKEQKLIAEAVLHGENPTNEQVAKAITLLLIIADALTLDDVAGPLYDKQAKAIATELPQDSQSHMVQKALAKFKQVYGDLSK